ITIDPASPQRFAVNLRLPGWAQNQVVDGKLYRFTDSNRAQPLIKLNGRSLFPPIERGYAQIEREWQPGDTIELALPMYVRRVPADPRVKEDEGRVALERGPLVYCAEWPDNGGHALDMYLPDAAPVASGFRDTLLNGVQVVTAVARRLDGSRT